MLRARRIKVRVAGNSSASTGRVEASDAAFRRAQIELGVSAGVVLALAVGLVFISKTDVEPPAPR